MSNSRLSFASGMMEGLANGLQAKRQRETEAKDRQQKNALAAAKFLIESGQVGDVADLAPILHMGLGFEDGTGGKKAKTPKGQTDPRELVNSLIGPALKGDGFEGGTMKGGAASAPMDLMGASSQPATPPTPGVTQATESQPTQPAGGRTMFGVPLMTPEQADTRAINRENSLLSQRVAGLLRDYPTLDPIQALQLASKQNLPAPRTPTTPPGFTLGPGQERFDASGQKIATGPPKPETPNAVNTGSFEDYVQRYATEKGKAVGNVTTAEIETLRKKYQQADDRPLQAASGDAAIRRQETKDQMAKLVDVVIANPAAFDNLTPTIQAQIIPDLAAKGFTGFGKTMNESALKQISETKSAMDSLRDLRQTLKENEQFIGPIAGLQALNPYSDARKAQSKIDLVKQRVGKALEGGVLRKEDEEKYKKILATLSDEPSTAIYKVDSLLSTLERDLQNYVNEQRLAGRRVGTDAPESAERIAARKYLLENKLPTTPANIDFYLQNAKK